MEDVLALIVTKVKIGAQGLRDTKAPIVNNPNTPFLLKILVLFELLHVFLFLKTFISIKNPITIVKHPRRFWNKLLSFKVDLIITLLIDAIIAIRVYVKTRPKLKGNTTLLEW